MLSVLLLPPPPPLPPLPPPREPLAPPPEVEPAEAIHESTREMFCLKTFHCSKPLGQCEPQCQAEKPTCLVQVQSDTLLSRLVLSVVLVRVILMQPSLAEVVALTVELYTHLPDVDVFLALEVREGNTLLLPNLFHKRRQSNSLSTLA